MILHSEGDGADGATGFQRDVDKMHLDLAAGSIHMGGFAEPQSLARTSVRGQGLTVTFVNRDSPTSGGVTTPDAAGWNFVQP